MNRKHIMPITGKGLGEIKVFKNSYFPDCLVLTDNKLVQMKPSHYRNITDYNPI